MGDKLGVYDYLAFVAPGAAVMATVVYGFELARVDTPPGTEAVVMLTVAAFVVGHLLAAVGNALQPLVFGEPLFTRPGSSAGLCDRWGPLKGTRPEDLDAELAKALPGTMTLDQRLAAGATLLRQKSLDTALQTINQQIGFYRNMAVAALVCAHALLLAVHNGHDALPPRLWLPVAGLTFVVCAFRFRRFWVHYGYEVVRGIRALQSPESDSDAASGVAAAG